MDQDGKILRALVKKARAATSKAEKALDAGLTEADLIGLVATKVREVTTETKKTREHLSMTLSKLFSKAHHQPNNHHKGKKKSHEKHKDVVRIDQVAKRTHGWYVRLRFMGKNYAKFFSDSKHGGRHSAMVAAIAWRDQIEAKIGKPRTDRHIVSVSNTSTGVVGVRHNEEMNRYEVSWVNAVGRQGKTSVSIRKHGKEKAFKLACQIRQEKEAERLSVV